jgi:ABC-type branched-subunit amino acid transport system substrate-binding protein
MQSLTKIICLLLVMVNLYGQEIPRFDQDAEGRFDEALTYFQKQNYPKSKIAFEDLIKGKMHQRTTASYLMLAKIYWHLNDFQNGVSILKNFLDKYPESNYVDDANYTLGLNFFGEENYSQACIGFINALESTNNPTLSHRSISHLDLLTKKYLTVEQLTAILKKFENQESKNLINIFLAQKYYYLDDVRKSKNILEPIIKSKTISKHFAKANSVWQMLSERLLLKIGCLLPLMQNDIGSSYKEIGQDILRGVQIGVDEFNTKSEPGYKVELDLRDTERDPPTAAKELERLAKDKDITAVIGPVFSNEAQSCAEVSKIYKIPVLSPTATGNGIASVSGYSFQANPDFINRGRAMAIYAVKDLGLINLAVISSDEPSSRAITESFISEVSKIGGTVIDTEWYQKGATDLSEQLKKIRKVGLTQAAEPVVSFISKISQKEKMKMIRAGANLRLIDSLVEVNGIVGVNKLFGRRGKYIADSLHLKYTVPSINVDSINIPVNSVHGIFIPISAAEEIGVLTSQIYFYNIKTQILGTSEWYDEIELDQHTVYTDGTIFLSEFFIDNSQPKVAEFLSQYSKKFNKTPSRYSFFGFDAASLILDQLKTGAITRETILARLASIKSYIGLHSKISLSSRRINSELHILKYVNGSIVKIGEVNVDKD